MGGGSGWSLDDQTRSYEEAEQHLIAAFVLIELSTRTL